MRRRVSLLALVALTAAVAPAPARADAALLLGFTTGARLDSDGHARFLLGAGPDLLTADGLTVSARGEVTHALDGGAALLAGWSGEGLRTNAGLPLGFALGPALAWTEDGFGAVGGRARTSLGLWYARAILELDVTVAAPFDGGDPVLLVSLALRWVPWSPWRL